MLDEVLEWLAPTSGQTMVDGTLGGGGHTRALVERVSPTGQVLSFDRDPSALAAAEQNLAGMAIKLVASDYADLPAVLDQLEIKAVDGVLLDLGLSSDQLADTNRGFSFDATGPLDLRFDPESGEPAWRLMQRLGEKELADLIYRFGEERFSRRIARRVVEARTLAPLQAAAEIAQLVRRCVPRSADSDRIHPATRTFQALRIAVNGELDSLSKALRTIPDCLSPGGRVAVISFHSLEDRLVKEAFRDDPRYQVLTRKPIRPTDAEAARNPRARSAKLRVAAIA